MEKMTKPPSTLRTCYQVEVTPAGAEVREGNLGISVATPGSGAPIDIGGHSPRSEFSLQWIEFLL